MGALGVIIGLAIAIIVVLVIVLLGVLAIALIPDVPDDIRRIKAMIRKDHDDGECL